MIITDKINFTIKYVLMIILYSSVIFFDFIHISIYKKELIGIDNEFKSNLYENETIFVKPNTQIKPVAFYYPEYNNISFFKYFNFSKSIDYIDTFNITKLIKAQTQLAKNHGIYGFAILFSLYQLDNYNELTINNFLENISFPFFFVWKNDEFENIGINIIQTLINNITKYLISDNYIKINNRPILSIRNPYKYLNIKNIILMIRKKAKTIIGEIFIIYPYIGNFNEDNYLREFDAIYDFSKIDLFKSSISNNPKILYYSGIIYKNLVLNELNFSFPLFRTCYINFSKFKDFKQEKFYIANNIILEWEKNNFEKNNGFIFIDSWNDYKNDNYLEPDEKYGYASINSFSKSFLNLPFKKNDIKLYYNKVVNIAIHIHAFYEDLLMDIINKINLIPFKYDLFISTISEEKKRYIKKCLLNSNANKFEIRIFENKGRDIFPFISQMKKKIKYYKYICHIHTKKSFHKLLLGPNWREYIYDNLIGSREIISEILNDFEKNEKLGFIFPEAYYDIIKGIFDFDNSNFALHIYNKKNMNFILNKLFGGYKIDEKLIFPVGNMFWAKIKAIYQIFNIRLRYPKETSQENKTIMHSIERIWLYLVKLNGYYFKTIFKHY